MPSMLRHTRDASRARGRGVGRIRSSVAAGVAVILVSPFLSVVPAAYAAELVPVVIDLAKVTSAPIDGTALANETVSFDFTITCSSTQSDCVNLTLTDSFPEPLVFDSVNPNANFTFAPAPNGFELTFTNPLDEGGFGLVAGDTVMFQAIGHVDGNVDASFDGVEVTNTAFATVDNPDSSTQASDVVSIVAPLVIQSTITKTVSPSTITGFQGVPVDFILGASNTSNTAVDTLEISDPADSALPTNAYEYLDVTGISGVTFPSGADRVRVDYWDGASWNLGVLAATATLPVGTIKGLRFTFSSSNPAVKIARNATAAVTIDTVTTADVGALTVPFLGHNIASSQVIRGTDLGTIVSADTPFTITPAAINPVATKVFSTNDVVGGENLTATLTGQNAGDFDLAKLSITEPDPASATLADQGLEFVSVDQSGVFWPINADSVAVTYFYNDALPSLPVNGVVRDSLPLPDSLRTVIGFTAVFTSAAGMTPGEYATIPFLVHSLVTATDAQSTNVIRVDAETIDGLNAFDTASDDLVRRNTRIATTINKFFSPSSVFANVGAPVLLSLQSQIDPRPVLPTDTTGSTIGATSFVVADADADFWSRFNATAIVATEIPAGASLQILYSTDGGATYPSGQQLLALTSGPATITTQIPQALYDAIDGIQFTYTPTNPFTLLPPGFNVQPNIKVQLRSMLRGTSDPVIDPLETLDQLIVNTGTSHVENTSTLQFDDDADDATVTLRPLPLGGGPGYDMIEKTWQDVAATTTKAVQARSSQQATATISWGTAGQEYASVVISDTPDDSSTAIGDPSISTVPSTVYDAFDLVRIPAITTGMDPYLQYDAVQAVEYFSLSTADWVPVSGNPCAGSLCYGTFPGYTFTSAESADAIGVRLVFVENPNRPAPSTAFAPLPGSGVAATIATDRDLYLTFQVRDTLRSNAAVPVLGATRQQLYNTLNFGEVNNVAGIEARDASDAVLWDEIDDDQIQIIDTLLNVLVDKTWIDGPLGVPPVGTSQSLFPIALMTISATNASVVPVNELRLEEPTGGFNPFDYVTIVQLEKLSGSADTMSQVTLTYSSGSPLTLGINAAVLLTATDLQNVVGVSVSQTGRVPSNTVIGLQLHTQLREFIRGTATRTAPVTVNNQTTASVIDPGGTSTPPGPGPNNTVSAIDTASVDIEAWTFGVNSTKNIATTSAEYGPTASTSTVGSATVNPVTNQSGVPQTAAIQYDNGEANESLAVVTLTGQPTGNVRTTHLVIEDSTPTFWNAYNFSSISTVPLADTRKRVQIDVLLGYQPSYGFGVEYSTTPTTITSSCTNDAVNDCWVIGTPSLTATLPTMPGGSQAADIRGLRFTYTSADGSAWERPYNPTMAASFTVDRRNFLVSPSTDPVPSTHFTYTTAVPGEAQIGVFTNAVEVTASARELGAPATDPALWSASADAAAQIRFQHLPAKVKIKKSPVGAQSLGSDIPYKIVVTNTGGTLDRQLGELVITDRLPVDDSVLPVEPRLVVPNDPDTGTPYPIDSVVSVRVADGSNVTKATPAYTTDLQAISGDHQDVVFTFDNNWVLPRQWTITITVRLQFAPQLEAGTDVINTATVVADQPFDTCEYFIDNGTVAQTPQSQVNTCSSLTTVYPLASAPVTVVKGVRGVDAGPLDSSGVPIEESPGNPYDDLGILKTVPASSVTCDAPNVTVAIVAEYYRYPCVPITRPGGVEEWASTFTNGGNIGLTDIVAIDVLPAPNDRGVIVNEARGSKWTPTLSSYPTLVNLPVDSAYTVYYVTNRAIASQRCNGADIQATLGMTPSTNPPMTSGYQTCYLNAAPIDSVASRNAAWTVLSPAANAATLASVVAMKFVISMTNASPLAPGDKLSIVYRSITAAAPEIAETGASIDNQSIAYNSIAAAAAGYDSVLDLTVPNRFVTEPRKVGVALATGSIELRKSVTGASAALSQSDFTLTLDCTSATVALPQRTVTVTKNVALSTIVHGLPLYASCAIAEIAGYNQNPNTSSVTPGTVIAQAPQTAGIETIRDPNPIFGPSRPVVELSTVLNDYPNTSFTITKSINNSGALNGEGGSATAVTPNDLRFSAVCTFDNGNGTAQSVLNVTNISLSDGGTYTSPSIPVGSRCTVTETSSRGAQATTKVVTVGGVAGSSTSGTVATFSVDDSGNSVAYTNTYNVADLTISKSVLGAWYTAIIGAGEQSHPVGPFTANVVCTRQLNTGPVDNTYTASVVLSTSTTLTHTFRNIAQGSNCTITESVTGGATTVAISNSGVANNISGSATTRTVTNTFATASLSVTKDVHTTAVDTNGDVVYLDAPYTVLVGCTFQGSAVYGAGFLPDSSGTMTLTFTEAELGNSANYTETITGLPAGAACTVTETPAPANADDVIITWTAGDGPDLNTTPDSGSTNGTAVVVTPLIADGQATSNVVTVNNYYNVGHITVTKSLLGAAAAQFGTGPYIIHVECVAGTVTTYDGNITLPLPGGAMSFTIDDIAVGSICSAQESNFVDTGADAVTYVDTFGTEDDGLGIDVMDADPTVTIENWYYTGSVQVTKTVSGAGQAQYGAGPFEVSLSCLLDVNGTPTAVTVGGPTRTLDPSMPSSMITTFTGLPNNADCTLTETDDGTATSSEITDGSTSMTDVATGFDFTVNADSAVTTTLDRVQPALDLTNTFDLAGLSVTKNVDSAAIAAHGVSYGPFPVSVTCTFQAADVYATGYDAATPMNNDLVDGIAWNLAGLPAGAACTVTETDDLGAVSTTVTTVEASGTASSASGTSAALTLGPAGTDNAVTLTNWFDVGSLELSKIVDGPARDDWGTGIFEVSVSCELVDASGTRIVFDGDFAFSLPSDLGPEVIEDLPTDAVCTIAETATGTATTASIDVDGTNTLGTSTTATIGNDLDPIEAAITNTFDYTAIEVSKSRTGLGSALYGDGPFEVTLSCTFDGNDITSLIPGGSTRVLDDANLYYNRFDDLPVGADCTIDESKRSGANTVTLSDGTTTAGSDLNFTTASANAQIEVTNDYEIGSLAVSKSVSGAGSFLYGDGSPLYGFAGFEVTLECTRDIDGVVTAIDIPDGAVQTLTASDSYSFTYTQLPVGALCQVSETKKGFATTSTVGPPVTITSDDVGTAAIDVVNDFQLGTLALEKSTVGLFAARHAGAVFEVSVECWQDVDGVPTQIVPIADGDTRPIRAGEVTAFTDLPVPAECTFEETVDGGADLAIYSISSVPIIGSTATVAQGNVEVDLANLFTLANTGTDTDVWLIGALATLLSGVAFIAVGNSRRRVRPASES